MNYVIEVLLDNVKQRLFLWDVSLLSIPNGHSVVLAKKNSAVMGDNLETRCFVPIFASSDTIIDSSFISSMHEISRWVHQQAGSQTYNNKQDFLFFICFVDSSGTIAYYKCDCIS